MYIPLIIFALASGIHLYACFMHKEQLRRITKLTLMPLLLLAYCVVAQRVTPALCVALIFGFLGDYLLLRTDDAIRFTSGMMSFLAGHCCYFAVITGLIIWSDAYVTVIVGLCVAAIISMFTNYMIRNALGKLQVPCAIYSSMLLINCVMGLALLISAPGLESALLFSGVVLFTVSDAILSYSLFLKEFRLSNFFVMLTYIPAQLLIIAGLIIR